jgi:hypothetical protein
MFGRNDKGGRHGRRCRGSWAAAARGGRHRPRYRGSWATGGSRSGRDARVLLLELNSRLPLT